MKSIKDLIAYLKSPDQDWGHNNETVVIDEKDLPIKGLNITANKNLHFNCRGDIKFLDCNFKDLIIDNNVSIELENCQLNKLNAANGWLKLVHCEVDQIHATSNTGLNLHFCPNIKTLRVYLGTDYSKVYIENCVFENIFIGAYHGNFDLEKSTTKNLHFENYIKAEKTKVIFIKFEISKSLLFQNSNIGNTEFHSCDFSSCEHIIENSIYDKASYIDILWFNKIYFERSEKKQRGESLNIPHRTPYKREFYEAYRMYKLIMSSCKNRPDEIYFKAKEYNAKLRQLPWRFNLLADRIILTLNKYSNNHGQYWLIPVLWMFFFSILFYIFFVWSLSGTNGMNDGISQMWVNRVNIFLFINPTHNVDSLLVSNAKLTSNAIFIDWCFRLISAYLIFQTITAFRKYKE